MGAATSGVYSAASVRAAVVGVAPTAAAFAELYRGHASFTWACLRRLGVPPSAIDDAMQELWVTAHRRLETLHSPAATKAWLYGIARRVAAHQRRTEGRHRRKLDAWGDTARTHDEAERESSMIVEAILASLDARVREAFVLSELEGWTAPEIAAATGANTNTIYWRVRTAKHQLRTQLGDRDLDAEVIDLRERTRPPGGALNHCWLAIAPQLGKASVGGLFAAWSAVKLAIVGAGVTVALASGIEVGTRSTPAPDGRSSPAAAREPASSDPPKATGEGPAVAAAVLPAPTMAAPVVAAPMPATREPASRSAVVPPPPASPSVAVDVTADDARLLADAKLALTEGRLEDARTIVAAHRRRFADSKLADLRGAIELDLACRAGDVAAAQAMMTAMPTVRRPASCSRLEAP